MGAVEKESSTKRTSTPLSIAPVKCVNKAKGMPSSRKERVSLCILEDYALQRVCRVLTEVRGLLQQGVDLFPLEHVDGRGVVVEQLCYCSAADLVSFVLQGIDVCSQGKKLLKLGAPVV